MKKTLFTLFAVLVIMVITGPSYAQDGQTSQQKAVALAKAVAPTPLDSVLTDTLSILWLQNHMDSIYHKADTLFVIGQRLISKQFPTYETIEMMKFAARSNVAWRLIDLGKNPVAVQNSMINYVIKVIYDCDSQLYRMVSLAIVPLVFPEE